MKKITLLLGVALSALSMNAQNHYNFSTSQATYANLEGATSINNGQVWDYDYYGEFALPFSFSFDGVALDRFYYDDDYFGVLAPGADSDDGSFIFIPNNFYVQDIAYDSGNSASPLSYKVEGETGNRILKLEMRNAGLEEIEGISVAVDGLYLNFQVWLYESDNSVEIHYGPTNVSAEYITSYIQEGEEFFLAGIASASTGYIVSGDSAAPTYGEYTTDNLSSDINLTSMPANGTVYRFAPASLVSAAAFAKNTFSVYPNPASTVLNVKADNLADTHYTIYNMMGAVVAESNLNGTNTINVANLQDGVYVVKMGNQNVKFIKK